MKNTKYAVYQKFETLGIPGREVVTGEKAAEATAQQQRVLIAEMVQEWETPLECPVRATGYAHENKAWEMALELTDVTYDDEGERIGPDKYNARAAAYIAKLAVVIEMVE